MEKKKEGMESKIKMVSAINEALIVNRTNKDVEKTLKHIMKFVKSEKDERTKIEMIAAASQALKLSGESYSDREIIRKIVPELDDIQQKVD